MFITLLQKVLTNRLYRPSVSELFFTIVFHAGGRAVCGSSLAGTVGSNSADEVNVSCKSCVFSGRGLCVGLITRPGETYRVCMCPVSVIRCYINTLYPQ